MITAEPNPGARLEDWITTLPSYQQELLLQMRSNLGDGDALADAWLDAGMIPGTTGFGAGSGISEPWSKHIRNAIHDYLCSNEESIAERRKADWSPTGMTQSAIVGAVTVYVIPLVPLAPPLLVPAVAIALCVVARLGLNAYCSRMTAIRQQEGSISMIGPQPEAEADDEQKPS